MQCSINSGPGFSPVMVRLVSAVIVLVQFMVAGQIENSLPQEKPLEQKTPSVDVIASKNKPTLGQSPLIKLPPNYDFDEQKRVWAEVNGLFDDAESIWAELVEHLDDQRYSLTMTSNVSGRSYEWTVGDICHEIVARNLTQGYYESLKPKSFDRYRTLRNPTFLNRPEVKRWCQERKDKKLQELQVEVCELTVIALASDDHLARALSTEDRKSCVKSINGAAAELRRAKTATLYKGFGPEEYSPLIKAAVALPSFPLPKQQ
jgi:hypothetical protein